MSNSDNDNNSLTENDSNSYVEINKESANLTDLPRNEPNWLDAGGLFLQENKITELNADLLPRGLKFLDLTGNPLSKISGSFPDGLVSLVLSNTKIEKLGLLPETLTELVISGTPMARKYRIDGDIKNKDMIKRVSGITFEKGTIMVDNTPMGRNIEDESDSNSDIEVNLNEIDGGARKPRPAYNSDDTRYLVMILEKVEDEKDIKYRVQTLNHGEKLLFKQHIEPYEPSRANELKPLALTNPPMVYTKEGHGEDILFEQPVPPGCVYVTIEECSVLSSNWGKLLFAFEDKPAGIRDKLRDPVKYKKDLLAHFGRAFHVHHPEAERHADRTYVDSIHYPFLAWKREECKIGKSGVLSLDDNNVFVDETIVAKEPYDEEQVLKIIDCNDIGYDDLQKLLHGSRFPTFKMIENDLSFYRPFKLRLNDDDDEGDILTYSILRETMNKYAFTQSWSFKMFPGVHYNFSCRDIAKHSPTNERIGRRRAQSLEGPANNINAMTPDEIHGDIAFKIFSGYVDAGILPMISKMIEKGVDVNKIRDDGKTSLQSVAGRFKEETIKELLKAPGIDKTGAVEAVEASAARYIERATTEEKKQLLRKDADYLIAIINAKAGGRRNRKKTRARSRKLRKTRRVRRFK